MNVLPHGIAVAVVLGLCACTSEKDDVSMMCGARAAVEKEHPGALDATKQFGPDPKQQITIMWAHVNEHVGSSDGKALAEKITNAKDDARADILGEAASRTGVAPCPLTDDLRAAASYHPPDM
jgi:hypothetical protein